MLRLTIAFVFAVVCGAAESADRALPRHGWRTTVLLPAGLPRRHYDFRTTISYDAPYPYRRSDAHPAYVYQTPVLLTPVYPEVPYMLPGYYGSAYIFDDQGPYFGGAYVPYWDRLPYACGVYGYC
jgi:hypothetical protein